MLGCRDIVGSLILRRGSQQNKTGGSGLLLVGKKAYVGEWCVKGQSSGYLYMYLCTYMTVCKIAQYRWSICFFFQSCTLYTTLYRCRLISRVHTTGNHWRVIVLRIWECKELKNYWVSLLVNKRGSTPFYSMQLPLSFPLPLKWRLFVCMLLKRGSLCSLEW